MSKSLSYYRILADPELPDRWFLDEPRQDDGANIDPREFTEGIPYSGQHPLTIPVDRDGKRVQFNLAAFDMPVVTTAIADTLDSFTDQIERYPVQVYEDVGRYEILNVLSNAACLDESRSEVVKWQESDGRLDRIGQYRMVTNLRIDANRTLGQAVFRIRGWEIALIVSDEVKKALEGFDNLGVIFDRVD